jgi:hypothetical protein
MTRAAFVLIVLGLGSSAVGQETGDPTVRPLGYVTAGGMLVRQKGDTYTAGGPFTPREGPTGSASGVLIAAGGFVTPRLSVGGELAIPRHVLHDQRTGTLEVRTEHRDVVIGAFLRLHLRPHARWGPPLLIGGGAVRAHTRRFLWRLAPSRTGPYEDERAQTSLAATLGADVRLSLSSKVGLLPGVRLDRIRRNPEDDFAGFLGLGGWVVRPDVQVRIDFGRPRGPR